MTSTTIPHQPQHARQVPVERAAVTRVEMSRTTTDLRQAAARDAGAGEVVEPPTVSHALGPHAHTIQESTHTLGYHFQRHGSRGPFGSSAFLFEFLHCGLKGRRI